MSPFDRLRGRFTRRTTVVVNRSETVRPRSADGGQPFRMAHASSETDGVELQPMHGGLTTRVGDRERSEVCDELAAQFAAGRLTGEELDDRLARAMRAQTMLDLTNLVADLPRPVDSAPARPMPVPVPSSAWSGFDIICLVLVIGCVMVAGLLLLVALAVEPVAFFGAVVGGTAAAVGGAAAMHLGRRALERRDQRIAAGR